MPKLTGTSHSGLLIPRTVFNTPIITRAAMKEKFIGSTLQVVQPVGVAVVIAKIAISRSVVVRRGSQSKLATSYCGII